MTKKKETGITVKKDQDFSEWYTQVIQKADLIEYTQVSGCYILKPNSYAIWEKIQRFFDDKIKSLGVKNAYFPLFIPESLLKKEAKHIEGFAPEVAWVTQGGDSKLNERLAVRPTSETIMYDAYSKWIRSYRDLPLKINQWCNVVRWEFKHPVPFLRSREFLWQEGHTVYATKEEADKEVMQILDFYSQVFEELLAIPVIKGQKSDGEKFAGALYTTSVETFLPNGKAIQGATSHCLGQNFAKSFNIEFLDENGSKRFAWQNSWGISTRTIGILTMVHGDDKGIILPPRIAHTQVVIVPILFEDSKKKVLTASEKIKKELAEFSVELDSREGYTAGWKFNQWELLGVPLRIELGPKDLEKDQIVVVRRDNGKKENVKIKDVTKKVKELLEEIQKDLFNKAKKFLQDNTVEAKDWKVFIKAIEDKKLVKASWCKNEKCEASVKEKTDGAKIINIPFDQPKTLKENCVLCNKKAEVIALFAKSY